MFMMAISKRCADVVFIPFPSAPTTYINSHGFKKFVREHPNEAIAQVDQMALLLEVCARVEFIHAEQKRIADSLDDLKDMIRAGRRGAD